MFKRMKESVFYALGQITVVDIRGNDAVAIINNLTTADLKSLQIGQGLETFVTDVRGKTLGHVYGFRQPAAVRLIGSAEQSARIAQHVDRYIIREDAAAVICDNEFECIVLSPASRIRAGIEIGKPWPSESMIRIADVDVGCYRLGWLGDETAALLIPKSNRDAVCHWLLDRSIEPATESEFHSRRINARFPWYGIDLDDSNLPQELDRDTVAISFTKGCYLGQETVARLDALGQVQRKLVSWKIEGSRPSPGATLSADGKAVGRLTSITDLPSGETIALGYARRSHFELGAVANGTDSAGDFTAAVI